MILVKFAGSRTAHGLYRSGVGTLTEADSVAAAITVLLPSTLRAVFAVVALPDPVVVVVPCALALAAPVAVTRLETGGGSVSITVDLVVAFLKVRCLVDSGT